MFLQLLYTTLHSALRLEKDASETTVQNLDERFPEVVENIDSSEFISYEPEKDDFEQVEIDDTDNENEEFLEENEIPDEE